MYQNFLFLGDFNVTANEKCMKEFCILNGVTNLIKKPACFKNPSKPTCIDLIWTNQLNFFKQSCFETGLSDFHLLTVTKFKMGFQKLPPKIVNYQDYKNFDNEKFRSDISKFDLRASKVSRIQYSVFLINVPLWKEHIYVQIKLHLWQRNCTKPLWKDPN